MVDLPSCARPGWAISAMVDHSRYSVDRPTPKVRQIPAQIQVDGVTNRAVIRGQPISSFDLPDYMREKINELAELPFGVGELETLVQKAVPGKSIRLAPSGSMLAAQ